MSFDALLNRTMDVYTIGETQDAIGGAVENTTHRIKQAPCRVDQLNGRERGLLGREGVESTHRIFSSVDATPVEKDRIIIEGRTYDADYVFIPDGASEAHHVETLATLRE